MSALPTYSCVRSSAMHARARSRSLAAAVPLTALHLQQASLGQRERQARLTEPFDHSEQIRQNCLGTLVVTGELPSPEQAYESGGSPGAPWRFLGFRQLGVRDNTGGGSYNGNTVSGSLAITTNSGGFTYHPATNKTLGSVVVENNS